MRFNVRFLKVFSVLGLSLFLLPSLSQAQKYKQTNLVSDILGMANVFDPNLKNPWGITRSAGSPWWVGNNNSGTSTLYNGNGNGSAASNFPDPHPDTNGITPPINSPFNNFIFVPPPGFAPGTPSAPTGVVFNGSATDFQVAPGKQAIFLFATEDGTISGWNPGVDPINAILKVDNSDNGSPNGAVYKGMTSGEVDGNRYLFVTNFRKARIEVYDTNFARVPVLEEAFEESAFEKDIFGDERIPRGFAPFNVQNIGGVLFVTYALQNAARHDDVGGDGNGFVRIFTTSGRIIGHLPHGPWFNSPWGVVWTTRDFGEFSNAILVGNFKSGKIAAFNGFTYKFMGFIKDSTTGNDLVIDGLWSLAFGNDGAAGPANALFFSAGINDEADGLFGTITPVDNLDGDEE